MKRIAHWLLALVVTGMWLVVGTVADAKCLGDFDGDNEVTISELITAVNSSLGGCPDPEPRFVDHGDGTVTDNRTGLMWEKKTDDGTVHDKDNFYWWTDDADGDSTDPDGTAFTEFLAELNNCTYKLGGETTGGFAGHCDWRLPDVAELHSILLEEHPGFDEPCIDETVFGPMGPLGDYWSSMTSASNPEDAYVVMLDYGCGDLGPSNKNGHSYARAVRGGL